LAKKQKGTQFICSECSYITSKWLGKCPQCESWNSFSEVATCTKSGQVAISGTDIKPLSEIPASAEKRLQTGIHEFDTVMGGGIVPGSLILLGGEPGIGKSTLLLQLSETLTQFGSILYNCGEESVYQIKLRSNRLKINEENIFLFDKTDLGEIEATFAHLKPVGAIVDSIQTTYRPEIQGLPGSLTQIKEGANLFLNLSKRKNCFIFLVGHVTKEGNIAGPKALEHIVDVVLYLEGEKDNSFRILRTYKNRFGSTNEVGVFQMNQSGIQEVKNPSQHFIQDYNPAFSGATLSAIYEGNRPLLLEVQALVSSTHFSFPKRMVDGTDINKVYKLIAILEKVLGLILVQSDVYVNITGGIRIKEPGIELAILMAIYSSFKKVIFNKSILFIGEVGLSGEVRGVTGIQMRVQEAVKLGIEKIILPKKNFNELPASFKNKPLYPVSSVQEVVAHATSSN